MYRQGHFALYCVLHLPFGDNNVLYKLLDNILGGAPNSHQVKNIDIWNEEAIPEGGHGEDEHDPRPAPE